MIGMAKRINCVSVKACSNKTKIADTLRTRSIFPKVIPQEIKVWTVVVRMEMKAEEAGE